jgi:small subunit ribosomal protein S8
MPASKMKISIAKILKGEGFIADYSVLKGSPQRTIKVILRYVDGQSVLVGIERMSKPGLRVYVGRGEIPRVYGGLGITIVSTSKGVMTGQEAWHKNLGGELLCSVW